MRRFMPLIFCLLLIGHVDAGVLTKLLSCKDVISEQEIQKGIPQDLLKAIATVESGISPWSVNVNGRAHIFKSKEAAAHYIQELIESGTRNFSVGCMQLHYASHRRHFKSVEAMLEPKNNIAHAAKLIKILERRHGSIDKAVRLYHSASPTCHNQYKNRVYRLWTQFKHSQPKNSVLKPRISKPTIHLKSPKATQIKFGIVACPVKKNKR